MQEAKLKTAVLGLNEDGRLLLEAASASDYYRIEAVADRDSVTAHELATIYNCATFDDYRQLIIQTQLDCLLVAAPIHQCDEHIRAAMKKKFHILKMAPPANDFKQTAQLVRFAEDEGVKFAIGNPRRFDPAYVTMHRYLTENSFEQPLLVNALCQFPDNSRLGWETDPNLAGGGVLLHNCYHLIDYLIWTFGLPQQVYSLNTNAASDRQQRLYLTEDMAIVTMKFHDMLLGNLVCSRCGGISGSTESLKVYCKEKVLCIEDGVLATPHCPEQTDQKSPSQYNRQQFFCDMLKSFAMSLLWPEKNTFVSTAESDMRNMALIEAAYLSSRTGFPEDPGRIPAIA